MRIEFGIMIVKNYHFAKAEFWDFMFDKRP
jgi:hypothetical protein